MVKISIFRQHDGEKNMQPSNSEALSIRKEQVYLVYQYVFTGIVGSMVTACILAYIQWDSVSHESITYWLGIMSTLALVRMSYALAFKRTQPRAEHIARWEKSLTLLILLNGMAWGATAFIFFPPNDIVQQAVTLVCIAGVTAGAAATLSALRPPAILFICVSLIPLTVHLFLEHNTKASAFAWLSILSLLFLLNTIQRTYQTHLQNITLRLQSIRDADILKKSEHLLQKTSIILEMIAKGRASHAIYDAIALLYESRHVGLRCSMLELHGNTLSHGGAPSLPKAYCDVVNGLQNGPDVGSCGTSTYTGEQVLVEDIATDPKWEKLKDIALAHGLRCCWSEPIKDTTGKVLGAFGMYYDHPRLPNSDELVDLHEAAKLAGIVMEKQQRELLVDKFHSAFEYTTDGIMITDLDLRLQYINPAFESMTGFSSAEAIGKFASILRSKAHSAAFYNAIHHETTQGKVWQGKVTIQRKDGAQLATERSISPVFDKNGNLSFYILIMRDLTEHQRLEDQLQQSQKLEAVGTLVGGIAHDFNNILTGIKGSLYMAKLKLDDKHQLVQKLENIDTLSTRAADLIQQMLTFARKDVVSMSDLYLQPLIQEVFQFLRTSIPENIDMHLDTHQDDINIHGDTTQIHQILMNLVNNARDALEHTPHPLIHIHMDRFKTDENFIRKHPYFERGSYAHLSVEDNGCGIPTKHLNRLFEPFFTTKEVGKGTGLGLAMVFGAVKRHQGYVEVVSEQSVGTTIHIYIPLLAQPISTPQAEKNHASIDAKGHKEVILLVDDEPLILDMGSEVLKSLGYRVLQASDGVEAVEVYEANQDSIALIITDVVMPKMGGVEAIERIRIIQPKVKVIFATGYDKNTILTEKLSAHNDTLLTKPYSIDELSNLIAQKLQAND